MQGLKDHRRALPCAHDDPSVCAAQTGCGCDERVGGVATTDAGGNLRDMATVLAEVHTAMEGGRGSAKQAKLISDIFGMEAASAAEILLLKAANGELQAYAETLEETGSAARIAARMNDNTAGAIKRLQSIMESLAISVGSVLLPPKLWR